MNSNEELISIKLSETISKNGEEYLTIDILYNSAHCTVHICHKAKMKITSTSSFD